jgi:hypothetical protein
MKSLLTLLIVFGSVFSRNYLFAQIKGEINYSQGGISFLIPNGWEGIENYDNSMVLNRAGREGSILITPNYASNILQTIEEINGGYLDNNGLDLRVSSEINIFHDSLCISTHLIGTVNYEKTKTFFSSSIHPRGYGISVLAFNKEKEYNEDIEKTVLEIINSVKTFLPYESEYALKWKKTLEGSKLCTVKLKKENEINDFKEVKIPKDTIKISICPSSFVKVEDNNLLEIEDKNSEEYLKFLQATEGSWTVVGTLGGGAALQLIFYNATVKLFYLEYFDGNILLNGNIFYRTYGIDGEGLGPICF